MPKPQKITRLKRPDGTEILRVSDLACRSCAAPLPPSDFEPFEPLELLCDSCQERAMREDYGSVRDEPSTPKAMRYVAAEAPVRQSSGKVRKWMCYGNAENANGLWDNLLRAMED